MEQKSDATHPTRQPCDISTYMRLRNPLALAVLFFLLASPELSRASVRKIDSNTTRGSDDFETAHTCAGCHNGASADNGILVASADSSVALWNSRSESISVTPGGEGTSGERTRLCLGCHDGVMSLRNIDVSSAGPISGRSVGTSHPYGVPYKATQRPDLHAKPASLPLFMDRDGQAIIECITCHDPHSSRSETSLLRVTVNNSLICRDCHTY